MLDENKQLVGRFYEEVVNQGKVAVIDQIMASNFIEHSGLKISTGLEPLKEFLGMLSKAFPDAHVTVQDMITEKDKIAVRITVTGTHKGILLGTIPPTDNQATWTGTDIFRIQDGKIAERWNERDLLGLMQQLGVIPE